MASHHLQVGVALVGSDGSFKIHDEFARYRGMARPLAVIRSWNWKSIAADQRRLLWWGLAWTVLYLGVLILILVVAASQT